jgi:hypothetical protein
VRVHMRVSMRLLFWRHPCGSVNAKATCMAAALWIYAFVCVPVCLCAIHGPRVLYVRASHECVSTSWPSYVRMLAFWQFSPGYVCARRRRPDRRNCSLYVCPCTRMYLVTSIMSPNLAVCVCVCMYAHAHMRRPRSSQDGICFD